MIKHVHECSTVGFSHRTLHTFHTFFSWGFCYGFPRSLEGFPSFFQHNCDVFLAGAQCSVRLRGFGTLAEGRESRRAAEEAPVENETMFQATVAGFVDLVGL